MYAAVRAAARHELLARAAEAAPRHHLAETLVARLRFRAEHGGGLGVLEVVVPEVDLVVGEVHQRAFAVRGQAQRHARRGQAQLHVTNIRHLVLVRLHEPPPGGTRLGELLDSDVVFRQSQGDDSPALAVTRRDGVHVLDSGIFVGCRSHVEHEGVDKDGGRWGQKRRLELDEVHMPFARGRQDRLYEDVFQRVPGPAIKEESPGHRGRTRFRIPVIDHRVERSRSRAPDLREAPSARHQPRAVVRPRHVRERKEG